MTVHDNITRTEKTLSSLRCEPGVSTSGPGKPKSLRTILHLRKYGGPFYGSDQLPSESSSSRMDNTVELGTLSRIDEPTNRHEEVHLNADSSGDISWSRDTDGTKADSLV